jgi:hypothetical protein
MVESKCIEVDNAQSSLKDPAHNKLNNEQWQALIALHRTLLHEHHDFFLASQHPSASPALRRLASKYAMPARMWRHGIHSFLELLRHRLPLSLEHMLAFIYLAYSMMALLYETVPAFEDTWIECLGDLGRYRMAIEDDDLKDRETWTAVSRHWYSRASDKAPTTGRLYHHLAILARPNALQQVFYYSKSLCVAVPFISARESILTLFDPVLTGSQSRLPPVELAYVRTHAVIFSRKHLDRFKEYLGGFLSLLDNEIGRKTRRWIESGYYMGIANSCAIAGYGDDSEPIMKAIKAPRVEEVATTTTAKATPAAASEAAVSAPPAAAEQPDVQMGGVETAPSTTPSPTEKLDNALSLSFHTHDIVFKRYGDPAILGYLHTTLVFMHHLSVIPSAMQYMEQFPWKLVSILLNTLIDNYSTYEKIESDTFPKPEGSEIPRPLPEDFAMRGLLWADDYFPLGWFDGERVDDEEKYLEPLSLAEERKERVLWIACQIASQGKYLLYDSTAHQYTVTEKFDVELESEREPGLLQGGESQDEPMAGDLTPKLRPGVAGDSHDLDVPDAPIVNQAVAAATVEEGGNVVGGS